MRIILLSFAFFFIFNQLSHAQSLYSAQGLGTLNYQGLPTNFAMGEVGIGTPTLWHINIQNPAHLIYNRFTTFQTGIEIDRRSFTGEDITGTSVDGGFRYFAFVFPIITNKWSSSISLTPYSTVNYNTFIEDEVLGTRGEVTQTINNKGEGGLNNLFWSNGYAINDKLYIGIRTAFTFGSIDMDSNLSLEGTDIPINNASYNQLEAYKGLNFLFGLSYRLELSEKKRIHFGVTFSPKSNLRGTTEFTLNRLSNTGSIIESTQFQNTTFDFQLPTTYGFGVSYELMNQIKIGVDFEYQNWENTDNTNEEYTNLFKIAVGTEYIPKFDDVNSYLRRIKYFIGFNYKRIPYLVRNESIDDFGVNFGLSLPVSGYSSLDLAFKFGQLGKTSNQLVKETYFKFVLGVTINDRWFIRRKYD